MATPDKYDDIAAGVVRLILEAFHVSPRHEPPRINLYDEIAKVIRNEATPPPGCVRLPDGRDVKVLGELPMTADGCVFGINATAVYSFFPPQSGQVVRVAAQSDPEPCSECGADDFYAARECYSSKEAAEAARSSKQ